MCSPLDLVGDNLTSRSSKDDFDLKKSIDGLKSDGTVVGFYFSSSWYEPCAAFTELLILFYEKLNNKLNKEKLLDGVQRFEVIFVSSDLDAKGFDESITSAPWLAIPFQKHHLRKKLSKRFHIKEIPSLILVEGRTGEVITRNGRDCVSEDLNGENFPWRTPTLEISIGQNFIKDGQLLDCSELLHNCIKGIYFSAHWCPPCRLFTPQLIAVYEKVKTSKSNIKFEIFFVSFDRSQDSFQEYSRSMPWLVMPYQDPRIKLLTKYFNIEGIPSLVMLNEKNEVICDNARSAVFSDPEAEKFPWFPDLIEELNETNISEFQDSPCVVLFTDGQTELIDQAKDLLTSPAEDYVKEQKFGSKSDEELPQLKFFYEGPQSDEVADSIRSFAQIDGREPLVAIIDMCQQKVITGPQSKIDRETVCNLIKEFKEFTLHAEEVQEELPTSHQS